ncbi:dTDP-glucose 4,6-dehydratase [Desulfosarcina widdelii]|uniref:dTDP-glucose 4,6-dehydratase n=2 Tax=Desulfosarcina widdelii TaxID=947919 RepID=A0A5K7ZA37_9BACT|nr:dTDP-glucose 4,6-dehydratase [Desulfosarcina widdelii]
MPYRVLVTGALGFVGRHLIDYLRYQRLDMQILGVDLERTVPEGVTWSYKSVDLADQDTVFDILQEFSPTHLFHLAGLVGPGTLAAHITANLFITDTVYNAVARLKTRPKVIQAGSAAAYGWIRPEELPVVETQTLRPIGPYGMSKAAQDMLAESYCRGEGMQIIRARIFNLSGPGQSRAMVPMTFVHQFREIKNGSAAKIRTGNLLPTRDFIDIRDVASAFFHLALKGQPGEAYNIAGEREIAIKNVIQMLIDHTGLEPEIEVDADRARASDIMRIYADCSKIKKHTDWHPGISLRQSLYDMWEQLNADS